MSLASPTVNLREHILVNCSNMIRFISKWLVIGVTLALADIPWDRNFFPHRTRSQQQPSASRPWKDLEVTIAAYDGDRQRIGWFAQGASELHYRQSASRSDCSIGAFAEYMTRPLLRHKSRMPNFGPSIGNSRALRVGAQRTSFGAAVGH